MHAGRGEACDLLLRWGGEGFVVYVSGLWVSVHGCWWCLMAGFRGEVGSRLFCRMGAEMLGCEAVGVCGLVAAVRGKRWWDGHGACLCWRREGFPWSFFSS